MDVASLKLTPQWFAELRHSIEKWDIQHGLCCRYRYSAEVPTLTYGILPTRPIASAPPSVLLGSKMRMLLPLEVWGMLVHGREAESYEVEQLKEHHVVVPGVGFKQRWREYDGERCWPWTDPATGAPISAIWRRFFVRQLTWERTRKGQWRPSAWIWQPYARNLEWSGHEMRVFPLLTSRAVQAAAGSAIPQEILIKIVHYVDSLRSQGARESTLSAVALVCRAWHKICVPVLFRGIYVRSDRGHELVTDLLRRPDNQIRQAIQYIGMRGPIPWLALAKLLGLLPNVSSLRIGGDDRHEAAPAQYQPLLPYLTSGLLTLRTSCLPSTLRYLDLVHQRFSSSIDLLRLLGALPRVSDLRLEDVSLGTPSAGSPIVSETQVFGIYTSVCGPAVWPLAVWWKWPHPQTDLFVEGYPGLRPRDARTLLTVIQHVRLNDAAEVSFYMDKSLRPYSWILTIFVKRTRRRCAWPQPTIDIEFHTTRLGSPLTSPPTEVTRLGVEIEYVVIRLATWPSGMAEHQFIEGLRGIQVIDAQLSQLAHLRRVVLETSGNQHASNRIAEKLALLRAANKVEQRTCEEARKLAEEMGDNPSSSVIAECVVSRLWFDGGIQSSYWLSGEACPNKEESREYKAAKEVHDGAACLAAADSETLPGAAAQIGEPALPAVGT